ncbi:MAG TPA: hypothetical protein ENG51_09685, partial [Deltaproteobacteria bacterium]|nr:hypothetical protein [Deltaproteobacteria bacterium]
MKVVGVKSVIRGKDGRVVGYSLKIGKELDEEIVERLARGEKLAKVVYDPFDPYLERGLMKEEIHTTVRLSQLKPCRYRYGITIAGQPAIKCKKF